MSDLITIDELIGQTGSSRIQLAYLTKIGILPKALRKKINGKLTGCYPKSVIPKLSEANQMKDKGITYSQMIKTQGNLTMDQSLEIAPSITPAEFTIRLRPSNFVYLIVGLIIGIFVTNLNSNMSTNLNSPFEKIKSGNYSLASPQSANEPLYLIAVPKHNLDKMDKTNINYLIQN